MDRKVHWLGERVHNRKVVHLDNDMEMVNIEVVVLGSIDVRIMVALCMVRMVHMAVDMRG